MPTRMQTENGGPLNLTSTDFDKIVSSDTPTIVDFWAEWCAPCRYMHPIFESLTKRYDGSITFARVNVDENEELALRYRVFSIPTFAIFKRGKHVESLIGAVGERGLRNFIDKHV